LKHFAKYVDAYHILNSNHITVQLFRKAERFLNEFEYEFEELYGGINMVLNVHLTKHISKCVLRNGPLHCYSAYNMEDSIGHLVSSIHGNTDVILQCTQKYLLERNLKVKLENSVIAQDYYNKIEDVRRANKPLRNLFLSEDEINFILNTIQCAPVEAFSSVWIENDFYRVENNANIGKRKTYDSFIVKNGGIVGTIRSIFKTNLNAMYFLFREDYSVKPDNLCDSIKVLELNLNPVYHIAKAGDVVKAVFIKFFDTLAFSAFPNNCERN
jgi:hypothetical protein